MKPCSSDDRFSANAQLHPFRPPPDDQTDEHRITLAKMLPDVLSSLAASTQIVASVLTAGHDDGKAEESRTGTRTCATNNDTGKLKDQAVDEKRQ